MEEDDSQKPEKNSDSFQWDEHSQLYFHASSGFYHDPNAGWYYSSRDGLYYRYEDGAYVLLESEKNEESEACESTTMSYDEPVQEKQCSMECRSHDPSDNPPPPSEWLEETLINLYLSGYSNSEINSDDFIKNTETAGSSNKDECQILPEYSCLENTKFEEIHTDKWVTTDTHDVSESGDGVSDSGVPLEEKNWLAQYGQVIERVEDGPPLFSVIDLWNWEMVFESAQKHKTQVARLVGRLVKRSTKLHPSISSGGSLLKTAAIRETYLDLVRVASGQVYRLRTPSSRYLASLSKYDSSDPTKDWGFPDLNVNMPNIPSVYKGDCGSGYTHGVTVSDSAANPDQLISISEKHHSHVYRDRAAERRTLHGDFGIGPGHKNNSGEEELSFVSVQAEEAAAEAMNMSFGAGSYARRILESMGWKEGETLGNTNKGLTEPLQATGNRGYAGLGWNQGRAV